MTARRFPCAYAFLGMMILLGTDRTAFGRQAAAEARSQKEEKREKTDGKPSTVQVATIKKTNLYNYKGRYQVQAYPSRTAKLYTNTSGTIRGLKLRLGDRVKQGETIAEIESAELRREIETREQFLRRSEITIELAKSGIRRMEKLIDITKNKHFNRKKNPLKLEAELGVMREELDVVKLKMEAAMFDFDDAKRSLKQARERLASARYVAPFDGELIAVNVEDGDRVVPTGVESGKPAFVLGDFRIVHYKSDGQYYAGLKTHMIETGMKSVLFGSGESQNDDPETIGIVAWVNPYREAKNSSRRFIIQVTNQDKKIKYHDVSWASIRTTVINDVLAIPTSACLYEDNYHSFEPDCFRIVEGKIMKTKIQTTPGGFDIDDPTLKICAPFRKNIFGSYRFGMSIHQKDIIVNGLKEGDVVVVAVESGSIDDLVDGEKVVIKPANENDKSDP